MTPGKPPKIVELIVRLLLPPACREEILGDLHERCSSSWQYVMDAILTVPMVIGSRIRRTTDPQVLLMEAMALYLAFTGTAWVMDPALVADEWALICMAIPSGAALLGLVLEDAYSMPGNRSPFRVVRVIGSGVIVIAAYYIVKANR